jgi:hypothetical protein
MGSFMWSFLLCRPFRFIDTKTLNYLAFQSFDFEHTWWRLFQKTIMYTTFNILVFIAIKYTMETTQIWVKLGIWCLMPLSTIFQLYRGGQFYWWRKPERKSPNCHLWVTDKLYHIMFYWIWLVWVGFELTNLDDRHDITEILLKVALNTKTLT